MKLEMPDLNLPKIDIPDLNLPKVDMPEFADDIDFPSTEEMFDAAKDGVHIVIGTGVVAAQRLQDAARDLQERFDGFENRGEGLDNFRESVSRLGEVPAVQAIDEQVQAVEDRVDDVLDAVESKLPTPAQFVLNSVREVAKDSSDQARHFIGLSA